MLKVTLGTFTYLFHLWRPYMRIIFLSQKNRDRSCNFLIYQRWSYSSLIAVSGRELHFGKKQEGGAFLLTLICECSVIWFHLNVNLSSEQHCIGTVLADASWLWIFITARKMHRTCVASRSGCFLSMSGLLVEIGDLTTALLKLACCS